MKRKCTLFQEEELPSVANNIFAITFILECNWLPSLLQVGTKGTAKVSSYISQPVSHVGFIEY